MDIQNRNVRSMQEDIRQLDFAALKRAGYRGAVFDKDNCLVKPKRFFVTDVVSANMSMGRIRQYLTTTDLSLNSRKPGRIANAPLVHKTS